MTPTREELEKLINELREHKLHEEADRIEQAIKDREEFLKENK